MRLFILAAASLGTIACATAQTAPQASATAPAAPETQRAAATAGDPALAALFEDYDAALLELSPLSKAYRGIIDEDYGTWGDVSEANAAARLDLMRATAARLRAEFDPATLSVQDRLSYEIFLREVANAERLEPFERHGFLFNQMFGQQSAAPAFLINIHRIGTVEHARAYIARIADIGRIWPELAQQSAARAADGIMPPKWVYPRVISDIDNLLEAGMDNAVLADFADKVAALEIAADEKAALIAAAEAAWRDEAMPAMALLRAEMVRQEAMAGTDDGVWRLPDGDTYYRLLLRQYTDSDYSPEEVHQIGLANVARIHAEMRAIMRQVGFEGSLSDFFEHTRTDPRFFAKSRAEYLEKAAAVQARMDARLPLYFGLLPTDPLVVKPVEAFREKSAGKAFYQSPAPDGSRPGVYYVNLYDLNAMSLNELEALAYHEGNPGHHLQRSIQTGLEGLPAFRRFGGQTAYSEGWGLYSEELGKDMGFYTDPYSDFGRLGMELWRAARLVVDTGIHHQRWSREEAIDYLMTNTPNPEGDVVKAIERYIVMPGQATAYMIGKLRIMEARAEAAAALGEDFDWRGFHDAILSTGPVPLDVMDKNVERWVAERQAARAGTASGGAQ
ncbi:DUF885 domain-containing protein [Sphingomicrobium astaxanthinifaciens]|uniref:DUF885 domain-containing protein n=1 Tax=Sphingomicrobium astaxanthinifaciens TaxID=1227949 RepID=UPI001FCA96A7|nr:DUF885 domain-containing protein [Sphingomicrobium astaxanthinifaciens]MCJ7421325.1 DUF885 domain-containing protein [Sphingomicrobium astaxanthinifaciens]